MSDGGKGSKQRPTDLKKYEENWNNIFGTKKKTEQDEEYKEKWRLRMSRACHGVFCVRCWSEMAMAFCTHRKINAYRR